MPFLNQQDRESLRQQLLGMPFPRAKGRVRRMDPDSRIMFLRNSEDPQTLHTRYILPNLGVAVTLIEGHDVNKDKRGRLMSGFELIDVRVEPLPGNQT